MLKFLENNLNVDLAPIVSGNKTVTLALTCDQSNVVPHEFSAYCCDVNGVRLTTDLPFTVSISQTDSQLFTLNLDFSVGKYYPNHFYYIKILNTSNDDYYILNIKTDFFTPLSENLWTNSDNEIYEISGIQYKEKVTSKSLNNKFKALLNNTGYLFNKITKLYELYNHKSPIDDVMALVQSGVFPINSTVTFTKNLNDDISTTLITYSDNSKCILATYNYSDYNIVRVTKKGSVTSDVETSSMPLLDSITISELKSDGVTLVKNIGTIEVKREPLEFNNVFLKDYDDSLSDEVIDIDADNILSEYKYYRTDRISGYTVVVN